MEKARQVVQNQTISDEVMNDCVKAYQTKVEDRWNLLPDGRQIRRIYGGVILTGDE